MDCGLQSMRPLPLTVPLTLATTPSARPVISVGCNAEPNAMPGTARSANPEPLERLCLMSTRVTSASVIGVRRTASASITPSARVRLAPRASKGSKRSVSSRSSSTKAASFMVTILSRYDHDPLELRMSSGTEARRMSASSNRPDTSSPKRPVRSETAKFTPERIDPSCTLRDFAVSVPGHAKPTGPLAIASCVPPIEPARSSAPVPAAIRKPAGPAPFPACSIGLPGTGQSVRL